MCVCASVCGTMQCNAPDPGDELSLVTMLAQSGVQLGPLTERFKSTNWSLWPGSPDLLAKHCMMYWMMTITSAHKEQGTLICSGNVGNIGAGNSKLYFSLTINVLSRIFLAGGCLVSNLMSGKSCLVELKKRGI